jgi:uncharacterized protein (DUF697 family)
MLTPPGCLGNIPSMAFWNVIKEVSAHAVREEARKLFVLALAGEPECVEAARKLALGPSADGAQSAAAAPFLFCATPPYSEADEKRLRHADLLVSLPGGPGLTDFRPADTIRLERPGEVLQQALAHRPDLRVAFARRLPGFRPMAAEQVVREVSRVNAEFAAISGISTSVPFLAPFFPAVAGTDILILTKNQLIMIFRLAAIYGEELDLRSRMREVLPVIGGAFGWRALARELAGALPGALGVPIRAGIAYSGTFSVGRGAQMVFDEGRRPTREELLRIREEAAEGAKILVARLRERFGRAERREEADEIRKALPLPEESLDELPDASSEAPPGSPDEYPL